MAMVLQYYGHNTTEQKLIKAMGCTPEFGTSPPQIARHLRSIRHKHKQQSRMSLPLIGAYLERGWPVIVAYQAWPHRPSETDLAHTWDNGHYSIAVALEDNRICLVDPSSKRKRRWLNSNEFVAHWRDIETAARVYMRWGVAVGPRYHRRVSHALV
jgi:ABC-type bacteriocin/lantibiotic exporter with double-glycine peptidase domain